MNISVAALDGGKVDVQQTEVEELGTRLRGTTLLGDPGNADPRGVFNAMHTRCAVRGHLTWSKRSTLPGSGDSSLRCGAAVTPSPACRPSTEAC